MVPLLSPTQVAAMASGAGAASGPDQRMVDSRIEEYLHEAIGSWLPQAFPEAKAGTARKASIRRFRGPFFFG